MEDRRNPSDKLSDAIFGPANDRVQGILDKRAIAKALLGGTFRGAVDGYDVEPVVQVDADDLAELMANVPPIRRQATPRRGGAE